MLDLVFKEKLVRESDKNKKKGKRKKKKKKKKDDDDDDKKKEPQMPLEQKNAIYRRLMGDEYFDFPEQEVVHDAFTLDIDII